MKKTIKIEHNTQKKVTVKKDRDWEEYLNTISLQMSPANGTMKKRLAIKLLTWARENKKAYSLERFINNQGIPEKTFYRWCEQCPELEEAKNVALIDLGLNREELAMERNLTMNHVTAFTLPHYLSRYDKALRHREDIKSDNEKYGNQVVIIERFPETDIVKKKDKDG
jgi:hypothetical protein